MFAQHGSHQTNARPDAARAAQETGGGGDDSLEDAARGERDYVRERLREELKREPTEDEVSDWLRQHTEGY